ARPRPRRRRRAAGRLRAGGADARGLLHRPRARLDPRRRRRRERRGGGGGRRRRWNALVSPRRFLEVFRRAFTLQSGRPMIGILTVVLALPAYGLAAGNVTIQAGDSDTAGRKAWITSQFAVAMLICYVASLLYTFFIAVAAGMPVIQDDEDKVGAIL